MNNENKPGMPRWDDQLWDILHAMQYRSFIALVPLIAILFNPSHTPLMEAIRVICLILSFGVAWAIIRSQQHMLKQLKDKYGKRGYPLYSSTPKM